MKDPEWKFTNTYSFLKNIFSSSDFSPSPSTDKNGSDKGMFCFSGTHEVRFHNGILQEDSIKNLPEGVKLCTWKNLTPDFPAWSGIATQNFKRKRDGFYHLAGAFPLDSYILFVQKDCKIAKPLHIHFSFDRIRANQPFTHALRFPEF